MGRRFGLMRHLVDVLRSQPTTGPSGAPAREWGVWEKDVWADVRPLSGKDQASQEKVELRVTFKVELRYLEGLTSKDRFRLEDGRLLEIHDLRSYRELEVYHEALCTEVGDGAPLRS